MRRSTAVRIRSLPGVSGGPRIRSVVRSTIMGSAGTLLGIAIALAILAVVAGLSILGAGTSAGIGSAITEINSFLVLIGLGTAVGLVIKALSLTGA
jgi:hypothetical protein